MADAPKRISGLATEATTYNGAAYIAVDVATDAATKKQQLSTLIPEIYRLELGGWNMQDTLYQNVAIDSAIAQRVIAIMCISIIDDTALRNVHFASGMFDAIFYDNYKYGQAEAQVQNAHIHTNPTYSTETTSTIPTHSHGVIPSNSNSTVAVNSASVTYTGFAGTVIAVRAYIDKTTNELKLMHNNTQNSTGRELVEGFATISANGQMANFTNTGNNRGYAYLLLEPATA